MPHVATDNASAPPAFTGSTSFPFLFPFKFPFKLFDSRKTICRNGSRLYSNLSQFQPRPAVAKAKLARIRAGVGQLIGGAELMRRLCSERHAVRNHHSASAWIIFEFFAHAGEERLRCRSI